MSCCCSTLKSSCRSRLLYKPVSTALDLKTKQVVEAREEERLFELADRIQSTGAHHCVVLDLDGSKFVGIVRLGELALRSSASNRILADLVSPVLPLTIAPTEPADEVVALFLNHRLKEGVIVGKDGEYIGLITALSVLEWCNEERKRTEFSRRIQARCLDLAAASGHVGIFSWNRRDGTFTCENEQMKEMIGYKSILGTHEPLLASDVFQESEDIVQRAVQDALLNGGVFSCDCLINRLDATDPRRMRIVGAVSPQVPASRIWAAATEISDRPVPEQYIAGRDLESAAAPKARLVDLLSHELRTPLTPVLLIAGAAAEDESIPVDVRRIFQVIEGLVAQEAQLIDQLLHFQALNRPNLGFTPKPTSLRAILEELVTEANPQFSNKGIVVTISSMPADLEINADRASLRVALRNILQNSLKYTGARGTVNITTALLPAAHALQITIADSGVGLTSRELERAFTPFVRGDLPEFSFSGLGLGLPVAQGIITLHGGELHAVSAGRGLGARFTVVLPLPSANVVQSVSTH